MVLAVGWHAGLFWIERSRRPRHVRPSLTKLLHLVELDLLSTLRGELVRLLRTKPELKSSHEQKLRKINERLNVLGDRNAS
jgi:hypothetical protein